MNTNSIDNTYEVFSKKTVTTTLIVLGILFIVGTFIDQPLSKLVGNQSSWWADIIQDMGTFPNVVLAFLGTEIIFQKETRLNNLYIVPGYIFFFYILHKIIQRP